MTHTLLRRFLPERAPEARLSREDETTGLPLLAGMYPAICEALRQQHALGVLFLHLQDFDSATKLIDWPARQRFLTRFGRALSGLPGSLLRQEDVASVGYGGGSDFMIFLTPPRNQEQLGTQELTLVAQRVGRHLSERVAQLTAGWDIGQPLELRVGHALLQDRPGLSPQTLVQQVIDEARGRATDQEWQARHELEAEVVSIVRQRAVSTVFQPIVSLVDGRVAAYEALSRGPAGSPLEKPDLLFPAAETAGLLVPLERLCRDVAVRRATSLPEPLRLFLNVSPAAVRDPAVAADLLSEAHLPPHRVVIELTERQAIYDLDVFRETLNRYRSRGFGVAIDDAGAGHSSLRAVAALRPDYIKIDMSLVRDIDRDRAKYALVSALATFARRIDALLVAEGIETHAELGCLIEIGVPYGQGYLIACPAQEFTAPDESLASWIREQIELREKKMSGRAVCAADVAKPAVSLNVSQHCREAEELFRADPLLQAIVAMQGERPVGLVSRDKFFAKLGSQFGYSIFATRPLREGMNASALIVEADESLELVSRKAVHRRATDAYDHIVVVDAQRLCGVLSVVDLLDITTRRQVSLAKYSNPLSGLPGNVLIQQEAERRLQADETFVFCHVDLDHFKRYNDRFGFSAGDNVILLLGRALQSAAGVSGDFVGHIGGDDFVFITTSGRAAAAVRLIIREFHSSIAETAQSLTSRADRHDALRMSVSIAAITCLPGMRFSEISEGAFRSKKLAKANRGDAFVWDGALMPMHPGPASRAADAA